MAGAIKMVELAVAAHAGPPPDPERGVCTELARRQLQHDAEDVVGGKEVVAGPRKRIHVLEVGEVLAVAPVERLQHADEINEEGLAPRAGEERIGAGLDDVRLRSEGHFGVAYDRRADSLGLASLRPGCL